MNRRAWMTVAAGGLLPGCVPFGGGGGGGSGGRWDRRTLERADGLMRKSGCRGWAAWEQGTLMGSWRTHESGPVMSITKVLATLACVKAAGEGWLDAGERVADTLAEWRGVEGRQEVTILMLLQMTAGLDEGVAELYRAKPRDKGAVAVSLPMKDKPGTVFRYGPACWEVLGEVLQRKCAAQGSNLEAFMHRGVVRPVGLTRGPWKPDGLGRSYLSTGAEATVTGLGRLGRTLLELMNGRDAAGFPAQGFREMTRVSPANPLFGGGLWRNRGTHEIEVEEQLDGVRGAAFWSGACLSKHQPRSMAALIGSAGQRVYLWPDSGRVMVRLGYTPSWRDRPLLEAI